MPKTKIVRFRDTDFEVQLNGDKSYLDHVWIWYADIRCPIEVSTLQQLRIVGGHTLAFYLLEGARK